MAAGETDKSARRKKRVEAAIGLPARPPEQLPALPPRVRWEAARRHPVYAAFWQDARRYLLEPQPADEEERFSRFLAFLLVVKTGVTGTPVDPATPVAELLEGDGPIWAGPSVQPVTLRNLALRLLCRLPEGERAALGWAFVRSAPPPDPKRPLSDKERQKRVLDEFELLSQLPSPVLDSLPDDPFVYLHAAASYRALEADLKRVVRHWKAVRNLPDARGDSPKYPAYLKVWDLVENWKGGVYRPGRAPKFREVAQKAKRRVSTVHDHYRAAFLLVTGHDFTPGLWWVLVAPVRHADRTAGSARRVLAGPERRKLGERLPRPVPESVVSPPAESGEEDERRPGLIESAASYGDERWQDLRLDLEEQFRAGLTNAEILRNLGAANADPELLDEFRERLELSGSL